MAKNLKRNEDPVRMHAQAVLFLKIEEEKIKETRAIHNEFLTTHASGMTFIFTEGKVQITKPGNDELTDKYDLVFNQNAYDNLEEKVKLQLRRAGVVILERKMKKGMPSQVRVTLEEK